MTNSILKISVPLPHVTSSTSIPSSTCSALPAKPAPRRIRRIQQQIFLHLPIEICLEPPKIFLLRKERDLTKFANLEDFED